MLTKAKRMQTYPFSNQAFSLGLLNLSVLFVSLCKLLANTSDLFMCLQIRLRTGAETAASPQRCHNTRMGIYSITPRCLTQAITVSGWEKMDKKIFISAAVLRHKYELNALHATNARLKMTNAIKSNVI